MDEMQKYLFDTCGYVRQPRVHRGTRVPYTSASCTARAVQLTLSRSLCWASSLSSSRQCRKTSLLASTRSSTLSRARSAPKVTDRRSLPATRCTGMRATGTCWTIPCMLRPICAASLPPLSLSPFRALSRCVSRCVSLSVTHTFPGAGSVPDHRAAGRRQARQPDTGAPYTH